VEPITTADMANAVLASKNPGITKDRREEAQTFLSNQTSQAVKKSKDEAVAKGTDVEKLYAYGKDPVTGEKLTLDNAPDQMLVDRKGNPIPFKMLTTMKPTMQESNRADFAKSAIHSLDDLCSQRMKAMNEGRRRESRMSV
jgi:hypothetical protein